MVAITTLLYLTTYLTTPSWLPGAKNQAPTRTYILPTSTSAPDPDINRGMLIPTARPIYYKLDPPFDNLTLAHFGWMLHDPFDALNFDAERKFGNVDERSRERYLEEHLRAPWDPRGPLCDANTGILRRDVCVKALEREFFFYLSWCLWGVFGVYWADVRLCRFQTG